jgi:hypothetical protein
MLTAFNTSVTSDELMLNISNLFSELNLLIPNNLAYEIQDSLNHLELNQYLVQNDDRFTVSEDGKAYGQDILQDFRQFASKFIRN